MKTFSLVLLAALFAFNFNAQANGRWNATQINAFHEQMKLSDAGIARLMAMSRSGIVLPTSQGYDQRDSGLCWMYATLSTLETNYLKTHPNGKIELSRAAMQTLNMEDRYQRKIRGIEDHVTEGGTPVNALQLMRNEDRSLRHAGLVWLSDYHLDPTPAAMDDPLQFTGTGSVDEQVQQMLTQLDQLYQPFPTLTHNLEQAEVSPEALAQEVLANQKWMAYGSPWMNHAPGMGPHYDSDARTGTQSLYLTEAQFNALILTSLKAGHALTIAWHGHEEELYGADFDDQGKPTILYIKGSYGPDYTYQTDAQAALKRMMGMSTLEVSGL